MIINQMFDGQEYNFKVNVETDPNEHYPYVEIINIYSYQLKKNLINPKVFFKKKIIDRYKFGDLVLDVMNELENID